MTPRVSVVMPVYNVQAFVKEAIQSVLDQSFLHWELIIVNDCSTDRSLLLCQTFRDHRIRIVNHPHNKGLAAARNTGVRHAIGRYVAFLDSDDRWHPDKLRLHINHLDANPAVGISFSRSSFIDYLGQPIHCYQMPQLTNITPAHLLCRNPVGNGSAPVLRREALTDIRFQALNHSEDYSCYFDENFRQSEDIECWLRILATTSWKMEGIPEPLTFYRLNHGGLSANLLKQLESWEKMVEKARRFAPKLLKRHERHARGYQLRYLARQAIRLGDGAMAVKLCNKALVTAPGILTHETGRTLCTVAAAYLQWLLPTSLYSQCERLGQALVGWQQQRRIRADGVQSSLL